MTNETAPAEVRSNGGLCMLDDDEADPARLWAEIHRLRAAVQGPDGFATWQDAAVAERVRRVRAERAIADLQMPEKADKPGMLKKAIQVLAWRVRVTLIGHKLTGWGLWWWWVCSREWRDCDDARCGLNCPHETVSEEIYAATNWGLT